jgi:hypothetical protein
MANEIYLKTKGDASTDATTSDVKIGEIALNANTGKLFIGTKLGDTDGSTGGSPDEAMWFGAGILDEDAMGSDSATKLATQQSIKAYVDGQSHTNTMGSGFTVSATTDSNATTITEGEDLMFTAGTGITCETTADGTVTITNTVTNTDTDVSVANLKTALAGGFGSNAVTIGDSNDTVTIAGNLTVSGTTTTVDVETVNTSSGVIFEGSSADGYESTLDVVNPTADQTHKLSNFAAGTYYIPALAAASTVAITSTPDEINLIDGGTARGTTSVASGDGLLVNDGGTMRMTNVDTVSTYFSSHNVGGSNIVTTGALNSGSITSGFGAIDNGSSTITTTGVVSAGGLTMDSVALTTVQSSAESFADNDTSVMTSAAIQDKITAYNYTTNTGDMTGVSITGGTNLSTASETNTTSGSYSVTLNVDDAFVINSGNDTMSGTLTCDGVTVGDDEKLTLGTNSDAVIRTKSDGASADVELTGSIEGTSDHLGFAANSLIIGNITDDADIAFFVSDGGNSKGQLLLKGSDNTVQIGGGATLKGGDANNTLDQFNINGGSF